MIYRKNLYELIDSIGNLGEINIVFNLLKSEVLEKWVLKDCIYNHSGKTTRIPLSEVLIEILIVLGLAEIKRNKKKELIYLSQSGKEFSRFEYTEIDRLTKEQGIFLISNVFKNTYILYDIFSVIRIFNTNNNGGAWINSQDKRICLFEDRILRLLQQLKIAYYNEGIITINRKEKEWLMNLFFVRLEIDEDTFLELLGQKKLHGIIAEEFVQETEKARLISLGREDLAGLVRRVAEHNVAAGYDILSFDGKKSSLSPDRFIEVKGNYSDQLIFYISKNELNVAKRKKNKYWLYCVLNVNFPDLKKIIMFKNPYKAIFKSKKIKVEPVLWKCTYNTQILTSNK
jgi:hypothetical protein